MKGYKAFTSDWRCRGFQYKVGETYRMDGEIKLCERGFHFCTDLADCFRYYGFSDTTRYAEVEATGVILSDRNSDSKKCTNEITIVREIPFDEVLRLCNTGIENTGYRNTGNHNAGIGNTGNWNTGDCNTGSYNKSSHNTGDNNTGSWNTGYGNIGHCNTGSYNEGSHNTGDWNTADSSFGCFCTKSEYIKLFDKPSKMTLDEWRMSKACELLADAPTGENYLVWIPISDMTDLEKEENTECEKTGGYVKKIVGKDARQRWYDSLPNEDKKEILSIPNFDADKFLLCTGIDVRKTK